MGKKIKVYTYREFIDTVTGRTIYQVFINGKNAGCTHNVRDVEGMTKIITVTQEAV